MTTTSLITVLGEHMPTNAELHVQVIEIERKETAARKPYVRLKLSDGSATADTSVWSDNPAFAMVLSMEKGKCYALEGTFHGSQYGLESKSWRPRLLEGDERAAVFAGPPDLREKQERDWRTLGEAVSGCEDGPLRMLALLLLNECAEPYRRAAAARGNHHARRGGLVEHVSMMAQAAVALCSVYRELRRDLLVCAVVFHDCGKMVENQYEREGFDMPFSFRAEAYGHIVVGIEMARTLWQKLPEEARQDELPLHALCHLIASHHGCLDWGSPVEPKMAEAHALHYIDNLDAKLEAYRHGLKTGKAVAPGVIETPNRHMRTILALP
ncbi:MAG: 3-5 exoribonuclease [Chthoniobacter sp.]|jgi:3'-5' exoribonuclease|nr:3-5 exoribonuclease [Chthoniobacter sp.]